MRGLGLIDLVDAASSALQSIGQVPEGTPRRAWSEINPFAVRIVRAMTDRWLKFMATGQACTVRGAHEGPCEHSAVAQCMACGAPVCPYHGCSSQAGDVICFACVGVAVHVRKNAPPGETREVAKQRKIEEAYRVLGLEPGVAWSKVKAKHRELTKLHHPDKGGDLDKAKLINAAFNLLKDEHDAKRTAA